MTDKSRLRLVFIGEGSLPIQCAEVALDRGHEIMAVVSNDCQLADWAEQNGIVSFKPTSRLEEQLECYTYDYLFSIVNPNILSARVLNTARRYAINYHDSPLPRYAGAHATSWAILAQEDRHGVTWHLMTDEIDAGDILTQKEISLTPDETAFSLNLKCYEAAVRSFDELLAMFTDGQIVPQQQDLRQRTYFALNDRPPAASLISWNTSAAAISALIRSMNFGPYENPLGLPKFRTPSGKYLLTTNAKVRTRDAGLREAGQILAITDRQIEVSARAGTVLIEQICDLDGRVVDLDILANKYELRIGNILP